MHRGTILKEKHFHASGNHFLRFSCQKKLFFCKVETYFSTNASFRVVETGFFRNSCQWKFFLRLVKTYFWTHPSSGYWRRIFFLVETVYFTWKFFSTSGNLHWHERKPILKRELLFAGENVFLANRNHFLSLSKISFKECFPFRLVETHFSA